MRHPTTQRHEGPEVWPHSALNRPTSTHDLRDDDAVQQDEEIDSSGRDVRNKREMNHASADTALRTKVERKYDEQTTQTMTTTRQGVKHARGTTGGSKTTRSKQQTLLI